MSVADVVLTVLVAVSLFQSLMWWRWYRIPAVHFDLDRPTDRKLSLEQIKERFERSSSARFNQEQPDGDMPDGNNSCAEPERGWMQTYSGRKFFPLSPSMDDVELADVAHGLAMTCRYGGQSRVFYSVAEHCILVSRAVESFALQMGLDAATVNAWAREALMHDSAEAYIGDMIRPLKHQPEMVEFRRAESKIEMAIFAKFGITSTTASHAMVKTVDNRILIDEIRHFMPDPMMYLETPLLRDETPLGVHFNCFDPSSAQAAFMQRYRELFT